MYSLIVYGSLINKDELKEKNIDLDDCFPIILKGFKREFTQEPTWRKSTGNNRAVLTVNIDKKSYINGILIKNISEDDLKVLDHRERGYERLEVDFKDINFITNKESGDYTKTFIFIGKKEKYNPQISPNPDYLNTCIKGAKTWGDDFYNDFINTTYSQGKLLIY